MLVGNLFFHSIKYFFSPNMVLFCVYIQARFAMGHVETFVTPRLGLHSQQNQKSQKLVLKDNAF